VYPEHDSYKFTMQSVSKLVVFIGLMEEFGPEKVYSWINTEPSGQHFASLYHLDKFGPIPSNPLINAGAIALCSHIPGSTISAQLTWVDTWVQKLFGTKLTVNQSVLHSEIATADRNRSLAYLMRSTRTLIGEVEQVLIPYFTLCSYETDIGTSAYLSMLLANGGLDFNGQRVISENTTKHTIAIMATCGMYDESGTYLVQVGMPAKSAISGLVTAVATGRGGISVYSPKVNDKGCSVRGYIILQELSNALDWHFAAPWGYAKVDSKLHINPDYF
jgi:glutaminase